LNTGCGVIRSRLWLQARRHASERYEDCTEDRVELVKARIRWLNELLEQLQPKMPAKETKH
jgi:hypothetical protein